MTTLRYGAPEEAGMSPKRVEKLRRLGAKWVENEISPAAITLVARRGVIVLHEAFGRLSSATDSPPARPDSIFPIASVTKLITATCAMTLVEDGVLGLNRPVQEYIPEFQGDGKEDVLVHHLLTHTSGITDEAVQMTVDERGEGPQGAGVPAPSFEVYLKGLAAIYDTRLSIEPGKEMVYSGYGYYLLGELIGRVSGRPIEELASDRVFLRLGMADTFYPPAISDGQRARILMPAGRPPPAPNAPTVSNRGSSGAFSTVIDLAIFGQTFLNGGKYGEERLLSRPAVEEMTRNQVPSTPARLAGENHDEASWGYGWMIRGFEHWKNFSPTLESPRAFGHPGSSGVTLDVDPEQEMVLVCFTPRSTVRPVNEGIDPVRRSDYFANAATGAITD